MKPQLIRLALATTVIFATAHARGDPGADPENQTAQPEPQLVRARFATTASVASIEVAVCALRPISMVDARGRELDMQLPTRRCRAGAIPADVIPVMVKVENVDGGAYVVIEAETPPDASLEDLRSAIKDLGIELKERLEHPPPVYGPPSSNDTPEMETRTVWYGAQTLAVDGISAGLCATIFGLIVGVPGLVIGAPIVHWIHGHGGIGFASLGMRVGITGGAGGIGAAIGAGIAAGCSFHSCDAAPPVGAAIGMIAGGLTAIALDAFYLAYEEKSVPKVVRLFPSVAPLVSEKGPGGAAGVLVGVF